MADACKWMTEGDLQVYSSQFIRTGFQVASTTTAPAWIPGMRSI